MGFRIQAVAISPFTRHPRKGFRVRHHQLGFESILKLITYRFGLGHLTVRDRRAHNIGHSFNWENPRFEPPDLPDPEQVAARPCSTRGGDQLTRESVLEHENDLAGLEALADRFGFPVGDGKVDQLFSKPDSIRQAIRQGESG